MNKFDIELLKKKIEEKFSFVVKQIEYLGGGVDSNAYLVNNDYVFKIGISENSKIDYKNQKIFSDFYKQISATAGLSNEKGLSAISGGVPVNFDALPLGCGAQNVTGVYKYDEFGSEVMNILYLGESVRKEKYGSTLDVSEFNPKKGAVATAIDLNSDLSQGIEKEIFVEGAKYKRKEYNKELGKYVDSQDEFIIRNNKLVNINGDEIRIDVGNNIFYKV